MKWEQRKAFEGRILKAQVGIRDPIHRLSVGFKHVPDFGAFENPPL